VPGKALLVPTCERDAVVSLGIFRELFRLPRAIVYNSIEERSMIWAAADNQKVRGEVVGVGSEVPETADAESFRARHRVGGPYMVYVGRIDPNKGCRTLFNLFRRYREETESTLELLLVGGKQMEIPDQPGVRYLGFLPDAEKWGAIAGAELLVIPSELESLSMVTLEAWSQGRPVLANGKCDVLRGQCRRSRAGLYYDDYYEFREALELLESSPELREGLGANGRRFFQQHYTWDVIVGKYDRILDALVREDRNRTPEPKRGFLARILG
jgi:glycosyltransferase involved in cell wall biosynthesis